MRVNPVIRAITATAALTLAVSSTAAAQTVDERELPFATNRGPTLVSAIITNSLDDADYNALVTRTARAYINTKLGGKIAPPVEPKKNSKKKQQATPPRGGLITMDPLEGTDAVTDATLDVAGSSDPDVIIVSGGDWRSNVGIARRNPSTAILDINAPGPCLDEDGRSDDTGECVGSVDSAPGNYGATEFAVEEGAYLAGVVAARESRGQPLGIIAGALDCLECDRYVTGFITGARSVEPEVEIKLEYLADDEVAGFSDAASAP